MFHTLTHHPCLTQAQHRALPHVSNTDLSDLKASIIRPAPKERAALFYPVSFH